MSARTALPSQFRKDTAQEALPPGEAAYRGKASGQKLPISSTNKILPKVDTLCGIVDC